MKGALRHERSEDMCDNQSEADVRTLAEWAEDGVDMSIDCTCERTINHPAAQILPRFRFEGAVTTAAGKLV